MSGLVEEKRLPTKRSDRVVPSVEGSRRQFPNAKAIKNGTLYFHYPCFDGLVSGVLAWVFLEHSKKWRIETFCPVSYEVRDAWSSTKLRAPAAVVDFLYHSKSTFWADHHVTTFLTKTARKQFERRKAQACLLFDDKAASCASLLWSRLRSCIPDAARYEEMVF